VRVLNIAGRVPEYKVNLARRREVVKTSVRALLFVACYRQGKGVNGNRNQQNSFSPTMEHGKVEIGAEILLRISREFGKSIEWLPTG
jgi:hypothetical protein